jgi:hypothetical protein
MALTEDRECGVGWMSLSGPETSHQFTRFTGRLRTPQAGGGFVDPMEAHLRALAPTKVARLDIGKVLKWAETRFQRAWGRGQARRDNAVECLRIGIAWSSRCCDGDGKDLQYTMDPVTGKCTRQPASDDDPPCPSKHVCGWKTGPDACDGW